MKCSVRSARRTTFFSSTAELMIQGYARICTWKVTPACTRRMSTAADLFRQLVADEETRIRTRHEKFQKCKHKHHAAMLKSRVRKTMWSFCLPDLFGEFFSQSSSPESNVPNIRMTSSRPIMEIEVIRSMMESTVPHDRIVASEQLGRNSTVSDRVALLVRCAMRDESGDIYFNDKPAKRRLTDAQLNAMPWNSEERKKWRDLRGDGACAALRALMNCTSDIAGRDLDTIETLLRSDALPRRPPMVRRLAATLVSICRPKTIHVTTSDASIALGAMEGLDMARAQGGDAPLRAERFRCVLSKKTPSVVAEACAKSIVCDASRAAAMVVEDDEELPQRVQLPWCIRLCRLMTE